MWHRTSTPPSVSSSPSLSLFLALPPSRPEASAHTRTDPTISPIQPPKSNYHGQNRVIKSNGLLDEVHGALQSGTSPLALRSTLFNVLLTSWLAPTLVANANSQSSLSKLFFSTHHKDFVLWYHRQKRHPYKEAFLLNSDWIFDDVCDATCYCVRI